MLNLLAESKEDEIKNGEWWHNELYQATIDILSRYKLFAFIIHDENSQPEFHNYLYKLFGRLDFITGSDFLFFTLVNPPEEWRTKLKGRDYFGIWEKEMLINPSNSYVTEDESISTYTLCNGLDISFDDLPVIVLTDNFKNKKFAVIKTCKEFLEKQLSDIGFFCSQIESPVIELDVKNLVRNIDYCRGHSFRTLDRSLAKALSDFLSFVVASNPNSHNSNEAKRQISKVIKSITFEKYNSDKSERLERLQLFLIGCLSNLTHQRINNIVSIENDCEKESHILLNTFNKVWPVYKSYLSSDMTGNIPNETNYSLDFSPLVITLTKIFELETNLSIVQWIRSNLKIEMPEYFRKHKIDECSYTVTPSSKIVSVPKPVNFNIGYGDKWIAPGIGQTELILQTYCMEGVCPKEITDYGLLFKNWEIIRQYRNRAAHTDQLSEDSLNKVIESFNSLKNNDVFNQYNLLKKTMRGK